jgi:hypothetical protein
MFSISDENDISSKIQKCGNEIPAAVIIFYLPAVLQISIRWRRNHRGEEVTVEKKPLEMKPS